MSFLVKVPKEIFQVKRQSHGSVFLCTAVAILVQYAGQAPADPAGRSLPLRSVLTRATGTQAHLGQWTAAACHRHAIPLEYLLSIHVPGRLPGSIYRRWQFLEEEDFDGQTPLYVM